MRAQLVRPDVDSGRGRRDDEVVVLAVADDEGRPAYASVLTTGGDLRAAADEELTAAGWVRASPWALLRAAAPGDDGLPCVAEVRARPRLGVTAADLRCLDALRRLTAMARGPVTSVALVPHVVPRWQSAASLLRRLVEAGQVRSVGRTADRDRRPLYAPVGSPWADEVDGPPGTDAGP